MQKNHRILRSGSYCHPLLFIFCHSNYSITKTTIQRKQFTVHSLKHAIHTLSQKCAGYFAIVMSSWLEISGWKQLSVWTENSIQKIVRGKKKNTSKWYLRCPSESIYCFLLRRLSANARRSAISWLSSPVTSMVSRFSKHNR